MPINGRTGTEATLRGVPTITLEDDPVPIVRVLGVTLGRAAANPALAQTMDGMQGRVVLRSTTDPQAVTVTFAKGHVTVAHGADPGAELTISADLETMGHPGAPKPKVKGAVSHPKLALAASKVLDPPVEGGWRGAAHDFWAWAGGRAGCPPSLRLVCTDEGGELHVGAPEGDGFEIHGPAWALTAVLTGQDHVGAAALAGRVQAVGDFPTLNRLVGLLTRRMLGDD
jgi:hypothetical protein